MVSSTCPHWLGNIQDRHYIYTRDFQELQEGGSSNQSYPVEFEGIFPPFQRGWIGGYMGSPTTESPRQRNAEAYFERPTGGFSYWIQWWIGGNHPVITRVGQCTGI